VQKATSFHLERGETPGVTPAPTETELCILREEVDPHRYIIGR
jgi:hypothetical protein